ncbi:TPA: hypothetical protein ACS772_000894 [Providencia alcalifaciens]
MTVSTEISSNEYTGNGVTTDFDYKFRIFKANQLSVITSDADGDNVVMLRLGTDYTVTGANKSSGGKVILTKPLANGHKISIARDIPITQETSFRNQSKFFAETHEDAFDYLTMILQRIWGSLGSLYLKRPNILANWFDAKGYRIANLGKPKRDSDAVDLGTLKGEIEGVNSAILKKEKRTLRVDDMDITALPKANERAGNVLTFDKDGKPIVVAPVSGSAVDVLNKLENGDGSLIGLAPYGTLKDNLHKIKLSQFKDLLGDGIDKTIGIQAAMEVCADNGYTLVIDGEYWVGSRELQFEDGLIKDCCLHIPSNSRIEFSPNSRIKQLPNDKDLTYVFNFYLRDNIEIIDPEVWGDKAEHTGTTGEWGHCYNLTNCTNIRLVRPKAYNAWGDGFYVGLEYFGASSKHTDGVTIVDAEYDNISRNGLSFCSGKNVSISVKKGGLVDRTLPKAGCDIEPEVGSQSPIKPTYENCHLWLNTSKSLTGLLFYVGSEDIMTNCDITVHEYVSYNDVTPLQISKIKTLSSGILKIENFTTHKSLSSPIFIEWGKDNVNLDVDKVTMIESNVENSSNTERQAAVFVSALNDIEQGNFIFSIINIANCPNIKYLIYSRASKISDSMINFNTANSNNFFETYTGGEISESCIITTTKSMTASYFDLNSVSYISDKVDVIPSSFDGVSIKLSDNVKIKQTYRKVGINSFPMKLIPDANVTLYFNGSIVNSVSATQAGSFCDVISDNVGNKFVIPMTGNWQTQQ